MDRAHKEFIAKVERIRAGIEIARVILENDDLESHLSMPGETMSAEQREGLEELLLLGHQILGENSGKQNGSSR